MKRKSFKKLGAVVLGVALCTSTISLAGISIPVFAETLPENPSETTIPSLAEGNTVTTNNGTVTTNNGTVTTNNGTVTTNNGTVTTNTTTGTIRTNTTTGTITTNNNTVTYNNGTVTNNNGTIENNNKNSGDDVATVTNNYKTVTRNSYGTVINNFGTVGENYIGTVVNNYGKIETSTQGSVINQYYKVIVTGDNTSLTGETVQTNVKTGVDENNNDVTANFVKKDGAITLSGASGYRIVNVTIPSLEGSPSYEAVQQPDGSWKIVGITSAISVTCMVERVPDNSNNSNNDSSEESTVEVVTIKPVATAATTNSNAQTIKVSNREITVSNIVVSNSANGGVTNAVVNVKSENNIVSITPAEIAGITSVASNKTTVSGEAPQKTNFCFTTNTSDGKSASVIVSANDLASGKNLTVYYRDPVTGGYVMSDANALYDKNGGLLVVGLTGGYTYGIVSKEEAKKIDQAIYDMVKVSSEFSHPVAVSSGSMVDMSKALSPALNADNISRITYTVSGNKATIDPVTGVLTVNDDASKGTITVSIKVTLKNGKTKTIKTKLKVD